MASRFALMPATAFLLLRLGASICICVHGKRCTLTVDIAIRGAERRARTNRDQPTGKNPHHDTGLRTGLIPKGDPLLAFVLLLQACMPCAQNTVVILQLQKRPEVRSSFVYAYTYMCVGVGGWCTWWTRTVHATPFRIFDPPPSPPPSLVPLTRPQAAASMAKLVSLIYILAIVPMGVLLSAVLQYVGL